MQAAGFVTCLQRTGAPAEERKTLDFRMQARGLRVLAGRRLSDMAEETKKTYTIRLPEQLVGRIEAQAASVNVTPTTLLQSLIAQHFDVAGKGGPDTAPLVALGGKLEELRKLCERLEQAEERRYGQLLFELVKTRSALLQSNCQMLWI